MNHTCQICAGERAAKFGAISHHGYKQPSGRGWRSGDCYGSRHVPYEQGHDALDKIIPLIISELEDFAEAKLAMMTKPPAKYEIRVEFAPGRFREIVALRPKKFDGTIVYAAIVAEKWSYLGEFLKHRRRIEVKIAEAKTELAYFRKRRAEWKAPEEARA